MVHGTEATAVSRKHSPLVPDLDDYNSNKDAMYAPDVEDDTKLQKKRRFDEVMAPIDAGRIELSTAVEMPSEEEINFDATEVIAENPPRYDEIVEYNILLSNSDDSVQEKKFKK
ncbi:hypothetical protein J6590_087894 [Homalodisca vitripennis]|nr:hypothetical protein J6590_087894 [Homalodisca vitripennis]